MIGIPSSVMTMMMLRYDGGAAAAGDAMVGAVMNAFLHLIRTPKAIITTTNTRQMALRHKLSIANVSTLETHRPRI